MTTQEILTLARKKLLEEGSEIVDDATLLIYANLSQDDIKKRTFVNSQIKSETISFTSGVGTLPSDFGTIYGEPMNSSDTLFPNLSISNFAKQTLPNSVTIEGGSIKVYPTTTSSLNIKYYPTYTTLTSTVNSSLDTFFHELIVYGILQRAFEDLQDESLAAFYEAKYEKMLKDKIAIQSNYEEDSQKGGALFSYQSLVSGNSINNDVDGF